MLKVLVTDDEENIRKIIQEALEWSEHDFKVVMAEDGESCLNLLKQEPFDALVLDLVLPGTSGLDVLDYILEAKYTLPVVVVSGFTDGKIVQKAREKSAAFVENPFDYEGLSNIIWGLCHPKAGGG